MRKNKIKNQNTSKNLTNMHKQNANFVKYVSVPTECVDNRNTSCRGTGLKVTMNRKNREESDGP
jgi:hypothetical protein